MIVLFCRTPAKRTPDSRDEHANPTQLNGILTVLRGESKNDANVLTSSEKVGHRPAGQRKAAIEGPIAAQSSRIKIYLPKNFCRFFKPLTAISSRVGSIRRQMAAALAMISTRSTSSPTRSPRTRAKAVTRSAPIAPYISSAIMLRT